MHLVNDFLEENARRIPDKTAIDCDGDRLTYAQMDSQANRLAQALCDRGLARGDRVVIYLPNCLEAAVGVFAAVKANGVFVVVNPSTKPDKLARVLADCRATALVTTARNASTALDMLARSDSLQLAVLSGSNADENATRHEQLLSFDAIQGCYPASPPPRTCIDQDLACLIYTSGSSGEPKGVMSSHANVVFATWSITAYLENVAEDVIISALPLSFDYGLYQLLMAIRIGGTLILERSFAYPAQFLKRLATERATGFPGVPTMFAILLQMDLAQFDLSSLRYVSNTGAALPPSHIRRLQELFPDCVVYSMYGLTETKRTLYLPPAQLTIRPDSVGIAIPGTEVWLVDDQDRRLGPNQVGELVVRGRHVMRGYWEKPEATAKRYRPGPLPGEHVCYTDDLFRMDDQGYLYFLGRKDDIIKSRGEKVSPKEVENVLYALDGVTEVAVVGVPDPILGQAIKAFVVANGNYTKQDLLLHCRSNLEDFMVPQQIELVDSLPKTSSGKIQKSAIA